MSKAGRSRSVTKKRDRRRAGTIEPAAASTNSEQRTSPKVPGQRLYDMPYSSAAPRLINPELGLHNLVARAGHNAGYDIDLTLLDAPDHRLIRSGVLLAHRVLDGRGEWYLGAPDWVPLLPKELIEPMSQADLSDDLAELIRPFRRRAPLGPVAALRCERREFALRDDGGTTLALLRDDKVTVRRGGLTTARYREVMLTPVGPGLSARQAEFLDQCFGYAGGTAVPKFPRLVFRLGAPATGPTDFPGPDPLDRSTPFNRFVAQLVATRLRDLLRLDLTVRGGALTVVPELITLLSRTRRELTALSPLLDQTWVEDLLDELDWLVETLAAHLSAGPANNGAPRAVGPLRSERYLALLDRLVSAARSVKVGAAGDAPTGEVVDDLAAGVLGRIRRIADRLSVDSPAPGWDEVWAALGQFADVDEVLRLVPGFDDQRRAERLAECQQLLAKVNSYNRAAEQILESVEEISPPEAFEAGRQFERDQQAGDAARAAFVAAWAKARKKLAR